jgi:mRNA interferase RelE/StbE
LLSNQAKKFYKDSDIKVKKRLEELFTLLQDIPIPYRSFDVAKIKGEENLFRIRLSDVRVLYCIFEVQEVIKILKIGYRENFY